MNSKLSEELKLLMGDIVDHIITSDIGGRGYTRIAYTPTRNRQERPMALLAAERLIELVKKGDYIVIACNYPLAPLMTAETDGPIGGAALARALTIAFGAKSIFLASERTSEIQVATCRGAGLNVVPLERLEKLAVPAASVIDFPTDEEKAKEEAKSLIEKLDPKAIIAIEIRDVNERGVFHNSYGEAYPRDLIPMVHYVFREAKKLGILTIGTGDGCGNEIGTAFIDDIIKEHKELFPYALKCRCPCGGTSVGTTEVDISMAPAVCNWAAYGIAACLSRLLDNPRILHNKEVELRMFRECIDHGGFDGQSLFSDMYGDGITADLHAYIVELLRYGVQKAYKGVYARRRGVQGVPPYFLGW